MFSEPMSVDSLGRSASAAAPRIFHSARGRSPASGQPPSLPAVFPVDVVEVSPQAQRARQAFPKTAAEPAPLFSQEPSPTFVEELARVRETIGEIQKRATSVTFDLTSEKGRVIVKIVNKSTGEVVRQLPPDELLRMTERMQDLRGMLFEETS